jgi:hypothetical protein
MCFPKRGGAKGCVVVVSARVALARSRPTGLLLAFVRFHAGVEIADRDRLCLNRIIRHIRNLRRRQTTLKPYGLVAVSAPQAFEGQKLWEADCAGSVARITTAKF